MYAMVEIQGHQYRAEKGSSITVNRVQAEKGDVVEFDSVLMLTNKDKVQVGGPFVKGARVKAVVEDHVRGGKVRVFKYKRRKRYKRTKGHRQDYTVLKVQDITA
ncbi:MAG: 50S ribosomal protein L21 [Spirochaetales bacterium]